MWSWEIFGCNLSNSKNKEKCSDILLKPSERITMEELVNKMDHNRLKQNYCILKQVEENKSQKDRGGKRFYNNICHGRNEKSCLKRIP